MAALLTLNSPLPLILLPSRLRASNSGITAAVQLGTHLIQHYMPHSHRGCRPVSLQVTLRLSLQATVVPLCIPRANGLSHRDKTPRTQQDLGVLPGRIPMRIRCLVSSNIGTSTTIRSRQDCRLLHRPHNCSTVRAHHLCGQLRARRSRRPQRGTSRTPTRRLHKPGSQRRGHSDSRCCPIPTQPTTRRRSTHLRQRPRRGTDSEGFSWGRRCRTARHQGHVGDLRCR
jgi:hypothetical protein